MRASWKAALLGAAVVAVGAPVAAWTALFGVSSPSSRHDRGANGVGLGPDWLAGDGAADAPRLAMAMQGLGLRTAYAELGTVDPAGRLARRGADGGRVALDERVAGAFLLQMRRAAPEVRLVPVLGGALARDVRPADVDQRAGIARTAAALVDAGAPGVHLAVVGATSATPGLLALVQAVDATVGAGTVSVRSPLPDVDGETLAGLGRLCAAADALVLPLHGTGARTPLGYETQLAWATRRLARALPPPERGGCTWSLEVPTTNRAGPGHDPSVETLPLALAAVRRGLGDAAVPDGFAGVVVQEARSTSVREWGTYEAAWRGRPGSGVTIPGGPDGV